MSSEEINLNNKECHCNENCTCGDNCECTPDNKCSPDCTCWENRAGQSCGCEQNRQEDCDCNSHCDCGENCDCTAEDKCSPECDCGEHSENSCHCNDENCGEENMNACHCGDDCDCDENCSCGDSCECNEEEKCSSNCDCDEKAETCACGCGERCDDEDSNEKSATESQSKQDEIFNHLLKLQAEFDNYRKRTENDVSKAYNNGFMDAVVDFLPALDSFKMAKEYITDKNTLVGIQYIEKGILATLEKMGVTEIDATGEFNPELHQAIDTEDAPDVESGHIVKECYKGFKMGDKVLRYSQVIVKK